MCQQISLNHHLQVKFQYTLYKNIVMNEQQKNYIVHGLGTRFYLGSYESRSYVEGSLRRIGNPVFFDADQLFDAFNKFISIKCLK